MDMLTRMRSGRFKVFKHLIDWFEEFRLLSPPERQGAQGQRRHDVGDPVRGDDAAIR